MLHDFKVECIYLCLLLIVCTAPLKKILCRSIQSVQNFVDQYSPKVVDVTPAVDSPAEVESQSLPSDIEDRVSGNF